MALSKSTVVVQASASNSAGGTTNGSWIDNTASYGTTVIGKFTNASAPTLGVRQRIQVADDSSGTNAQDYTFEIAPTTASTSGNFQPVTLPPEILYYRTVYDSNTGQAVTVEAHAYKLTGV